MSDVKLKSCPFCGEDAATKSTRTIGPLRAVSSVIDCHKCGATISTIDHTIGAVEGKWNARASQDNWISVDNELPTESGPYWTFNGGDEKSSVIQHRVHMYDSEHKWFNSHTVTHWMPLPKPPKQS